MEACIFRFLFVSTFIFIGARVSAEDLVRVRLFEKYDRVVITGDIKVNAEKPLQGQRITIENQGPNYTWTLENANGRVIDLADHSTPLNFSGSLTFNGMKLPDTVRIVSVLQPNGKFSRFVVIGILELERYLEGVLPGEMPLKWPLEALKAQLITARTYTLKQIENRRAELFDVDSTVRDQLYSSDIVLTEDRRKNLMTALEATRGMILGDNKGQVIMANYHADCGGQTELPKNVWNFGHRGVAVNDYSCAVRSTGQWTYAINSEQFLRKIKSEMGAVAVGKLASIESISSTTGGRVNLLALNFSDGRKIEILATRLRELLGYALLKSTRFEARVALDQILFSGRGFGHGVGLCQWGAKDLAKSGKTYREILGHYFPGLKIITN